MSRPSVQQFPLAPMSLSLLIMTVMLLSFPLGFLALASRAPRWTAMILAGSALMMIVLYALVWLVGRPTRFEVDARGLHIIWPMRKRLLPREDIVSAARLSWKELRQTYGLGVRIGAGGLWGGFGLFKTPTETFELWISRTDEVVLVRLKTGRSVLITPAEPAQLISALQARALEPPAG